MGLALTSISATPLFAHVPSSTTHATYLSVTAGEPGHALLPADPPRGVGVTTTRPFGSTTSTGNWSPGLDRNGAPRVPSDASYWYTAALSGCGAVNTSHLTVNDEGTSTPVGTAATEAGRCTRTSPAPDDHDGGQLAGLGSSVRSSGHTYTVAGGTSMQSASFLRGYIPVSALGRVRLTDTVSWTLVSHVDRAHTVSVASAAHADRPSSVAGTDADLLDDRSYRSSPMPSTGHVSDVSYVAPTTTHPGLGTSPPPATATSTSYVGLRHVIGPWCPRLRSPGWTDGAHVQSSTASATATSTQMGSPADAAGTVAAVTSSTEAETEADAAICSDSSRRRDPIDGVSSSCEAYASPSSTCTVTGADGEGRPLDTNRYVNPSVVDRPLGDSTASSLANLSIRASPRSARRARAFRALGPAGTGACAGPCLFSHATVARVSRLYRLGPCGTYTTRAGVPDSSPETTIGRSITAKDSDASVPDCISPSSPFSTPQRTSVPFAGRLVISRWRFTVFESNGRGIVNGLGLSRCVRAWSAGGAGGVARTTSNAIRLGASSPQLTPTHARYSSERDEPGLKVEPGCSRNEKRAEDRDTGMRTAIGPSIFAPSPSSPTLTRRVVPPRGTAMISSVHSVSASTPPLNAGPGASIEVVEPGYTSTRVTVDPIATARRSPTPGWASAGLGGVRVTGVHPAASTAASVAADRANASSV